MSTAGTRHRRGRGRSPGRQLPLAAPPSSTTLEGVLERVVYYNPDSAWSVVRVQVAGRREPVTAVGNLLGVQPGESLRLSGSWIRDPKYGLQFRVESYVSVQPSTLVGIERYLGSGLVEGIGKVMARRLVAHFGLETFDVIDREGERLAEVPGIGPVRSGRILAAWAAQRQIREVMVFLQGHGVSTAHAVRIFRMYGRQSVQVVRENPYRLAIDIFGIGFKTADRIAANLGIARDSPRRAEAGVLHALGEQSDEGHVFVPRGQLVEYAAGILEIDRAVIEPAIDELERQDLVVVEAHVGPAGAAASPAASGAAADSAVYLKSLHFSETRVAGRLLDLLRTPARPVRIAIDLALDWFETRHRMTLAAAQREAIRHAVSSKILLVTGGPGTGKTTIVNALLRIVEKKDRRVLLCAPTGRAAKRLAEATGHEARTIHRLLEFSPRSLGFERNQRRPLEADLVVVDELSMVDIVLAGHLLNAIPAACQLVLVGDPDQLPSVGPGNVLRDLIRCGAIEVVRLTEIFRQARRSLIITNAHRVNRGEIPRLDAGEAAAAGPPAPTGEDGPGEAPQPGGTGSHAPGETLGDEQRPDLEQPSATPPRETPDFFFIERDDPERALETIKHLITARIPRRFGFHPVDDVQVLTPMHRGILGSTNLNAELQALLTPPGPSLARSGITYRVGDKVMQIRNNYQLDVFNGDIGRVVAVDEGDLELVVRYEDREVRYDRANLIELQLAFACSIHKAQGSEYRAVVMPIHTQHYVLLQRNLLYTGITRGKELVVLVGTRQAVAIAVKNARVAARWTRLAERLRCG